MKAKYHMANEPRCRAQSLPFMEARAHKRTRTSLHFMEAACKLHAASETTRPYQLDDA